MFVNVKKALLTAAVLLAAATAYDAPSAKAAGLLAAPQGGTTKAVCGNRGCFSIKNGRWTWRPH